MKLMIIMKHSIMSVIRYATLLALAIWPVVTASADILSYWNFNNLDAGPQQGMLGSFATTPAEFGERYDPSEHRLFSNMQNGAVFHGDVIYLDLSDLQSANAQENGGEISQYGIWGAFLDTEVARLNDDSSSGGSFLLFHRDLNKRSITFHLSSVGYKNLKVRYAYRNAPEEANNRQQWSYSADGSEFIELPDAVFRNNQRFTEATFSLPKELNNQESFLLRVTFFLNNTSSSSMDNLSVTGEPIQP